MPLFVCHECRVIENTACSNFIHAHVEGKPPLCSACDPAIGRWHGLFKRVPYDLDQGVQYPPPTG
jgi:hypothetical protein